MKAPATTIEKRTLVICPTCSKNSREPLVVVLGQQCRDCVEALHPRLHTFLTARSCFDAKPVLCRLKEPCRAIKVMFQHARDFKGNPQHATFLVRV
ncbi:MAG: hypothetical protein ACTSU5_08950 [Promethearchaeota archaeon]